MAHMKQNPNRSPLGIQSGLLPAAWQCLCWSLPLILPAQRHHDQLFSAFGVSCLLEGWFQMFSLSLERWAWTLLGGYSPEVTLCWEPRAQGCSSFSVARPPAISRWMPSSIKIVALEGAIGIWLAPSLLFPHSTRRSYSFELLNQKINYCNSFANYTMLKF